MSEELEIIKAMEASFFKSWKEVLKGQVVLTKDCIYFSGRTARKEAGVAFSKNSEKKMGYGNPDEEVCVDIPIGEIKFKRGKKAFNKNILVLTDSDGQDYKIYLIPKGGYEEWEEVLNKTLSNS